MKKILVTIFHTFFFLSMMTIGKTQTPLFFNQGEIYIGNGENLYIDGDFQNGTNGQISNQGTIQLTGDWENNNPYNQVFTIENGTTRFIGTNQSMGGNNITKFHNVSMEGSGIKRLDANISVSGILHLNDRELATQNHLLTITAGNIGAVTRTSGFVSTGAIGKLVRSTNGNGAWLFPMGSSFPPLGYRPLTIETIEGGSTTFEVALINDNPTSSGYSINQMELPACLVNHKYFFTANRTNGSGPVNLFYNYHEQDDGNYTLPVVWNDNQWRVIPNSSHQINTPPDLSTFTLNNYVLASPSILTFADSAPANGTPIIYEHNNRLYAAQGNTFQWYHNGNIIPNATQNSYLPTAPGNYSVYVSTSGQCAFMSADYYVEFVGISDRTNSQIISIFPNPFSDFITVSISAPINKNLKFQLFNSTGKLIKEGEIISNATENYRINVENYSSGIYFIRIFNEEFYFTQKLIRM